MAPAAGDDDVPPLSIVIVDPHPLYRLGLEQACKELAGVGVVSSVGTGREGLACLRSSHAEVGLVELNLPDMSGLALLRALAGEPTRVPVVVLTAERDGGSIYDALAAGAAGYLTKDVEPTAVFEALRAAVVGDIVISPALHRLVAAEIRLHETAHEVRLTRREREVLGLVAQGCSSLEIGRRLFVSHTTVKTHLANAYEKLGVSDRAAAVAQAMKRGLVQAA